MRYQIAFGAGAAGQETQGTTSCCPLPAERLEGVRERRSFPSFCPVLGLSMHAREKGRNERVRGPAPVSSYSILRGIFTVLPPPPTQSLRNRRLGQVTFPCAPH